MKLIFCLNELAVHLAAHKFTSGDVNNLHLRLANPVKRSDKAVSHIISSYSADRRNSYGSGS